ncbi:MAG: pyridoxamine 5'-phosphate oxidase family protein [Acetobacteraceae bacterium]|nr:pyridoxamine 5'-phosphate oxidase family protein [Acetobacteraceae bacterium]
MSAAPRPRPAHADDLGEALAEAFRLLARGVADRRSPFHTPALATIGADGAPEARTLVLRGFDPATRTVRLHTDVRAPKWAQLAADPRCALHLYDPGAQVQIRLRCVATRHDADAVAEAAWTASRSFSRLCYAVEPGPATPVPAPAAAPREEANGRAHFGALVLRFDALEWLWLAHGGHRRARFAWGADGLEATWLVP